MASEPWTVEALVGHLRYLGVREGDLLMVHTSLREIGPVEGRADGLLDALEAAVGPAGTLLMVLSADNDWDWDDVNARPEAERPALLQGCTPFDLRTTPADPEVGALPEIFRTRPGVLVSDHPEGRFAAWGHLATELVQDVPWDDYYGPGSPLERFVRARGRVLRLGADLDTVTALHYAEYLVPLRNKRRVRRHVLVNGPEGPAIRTVECLDDSDGIVDLPGEDYFARILRAYLATGRARTGQIGGATSELLDAADLVTFGVAWMAQHLDLSPDPDA